jgi:hypothetical protein
MTKLVVLSSLAMLLAANLAAQAGETTVSDGPWQIHIGAQQTLLGDRALGLRYFPDEGTVVIQQSPRYQLLLTASESSYLVEGSSIDHLSTAHKIAGPGPKGSEDNGYFGVSGGWQDGASGSWVAVCHIEDHEGLPLLAGGIPGFYARVALLTSPDSKTWTKAGSVISSQKPKEWVAYQGQGDRGAGEPGLCASADGKYLYLYYTDHSRVDGRGVQICMARADLSEGPVGPGSFHKLYQDTWTEPGLGGKDTPLFSGFDNPPADTIESRVVYNPKMGKYVMILGVDYWQEFVNHLGLKNSGLYVSLSDDGVHWDTPVMLIKDWAVPLVGKSLSWEGTPVFDAPDQADGWLVYAYSPSWGYDRGNTPHYLVGRRISFTAAKP